MPSRLAEMGVRHATASELELMMGLPAGYTTIGKDANGAQVVSNIDRLKILGGGIDTRQIAPIVAGLKAGAAHNPSDYVKPHEGWNPHNMAKWLTAGPLPIDDPAASDWDSADTMIGAKDLVRCAIQGFPLRYAGDRTENVEAPS